jgi:hypothetical protein
VIICLNGRTIGSGDTPTNPVITSSDPVTLKFGWGTATKDEDMQFLRIQSGRVAVHQGSAGGPVVASTSWGAGNFSRWTKPVEAAPGFWVTTSYLQLGTFASGNYYVDAHFEVKGTVYDGQSSFGPGQYLAVNACPMLVS